MSTIKKIQAGTITYDIEPANAAELDVTNKASTLSWNNTSTIATVNGTNITVKLPENPNVDTKTTQSNTTTTNWRKVVLSAQNNATASAAPVEQTGQVYVSTGLEFQPSSGSLQVGGPIQANGGFILSNETRIGGDYYGGEIIYSPAPCLLLVEAGSDTELISISDNSELQLKNLSTPYDSGDAINKGYLESQLAGKASNTHTHTGPSHNHTYSKATSVTFTGTEGTTEDEGSHTHTFTGSAVNTDEKGGHSHTFTGSAATSTTPGGTTPTIKVATYNHTHNVTAEGTLNSTGAHTHSVTAKGTLNSTGAHTHALSSNVVTGSLSGTVLTLTSSEVTASSAGSHSHTFTGSAVDSSSAGSHSHTFTGSAVTSAVASASTTVASYTHTHNVTAKGSLSTNGAHTHAVTAKGTLNDAGSHNHAFTPEGTNTLSHTTTNSGNSGTGSTSAPK